MTPAQQAIVAQKTLEGVPGCTIAQSLGVHPSTVTRNRQSVRAYIEQEISALMQRGLKPARRTLCRLAAMGTTKQADKDTLTLSLKASQIIIGHANPQPGTVVYNLTQINQHEMPESISRLFQQIAHNDTGTGSMLQVEDAIDV
jgi:hypothetical protein